jgi:hypothetical protein
MHLEITGKVLGAIFPFLQSGLWRGTNRSGGERHVVRRGRGVMGQHDLPRAGPRGIRSIHWRMRGGDKPSIFQIRATRDVGKLRVALIKHLPWLMRGRGDKAGRLENLTQIIGDAFNPGDCVRKNLGALFLDIRDRR